MTEQVTFDSENFIESMANFGAALVPAIAAFEAFALQLAAELQPMIDALNGIGEYDWNGLELELTLEAPERWEQESLVDWGKRLERAGLLDQLEYRWMYQKECWRAVLHSPVWYAGLVWTWLRYTVWEEARGLWAKQTD